MKKQLFIIAITGLFSLASFSQNVFQKVFQRNFSQTFGGTQTPDGGFVMAGLYQVSATDFDYLAVKIDHNGDTLWTKTYGGIGDEECYAMQPTNDGGFILAGIDSSSGLGNYNVYLVKINATGDTLWTKSYGGSQHDFGQAVQQTSDNGYIIAGYSNSFTADNNDDFYLIKTDANGNLQWSKTYGGQYGDYAMAVTQTPDGGYIAAGLTSSFGNTPDGQTNDVFVVRTDINGNIVWNKTYGQAGDDWAYGIIKTNDNNFVITGHTCVSTSVASDAYLIKIDANGDTLWTKSYGGNNYEKGYAVAQLNDSSLVVGGSTYSYGNGSSDVYLFKTDKDGNEIFASTFGQGANDMAFAIAKCADGGFGLYGYTDNFGVSNSSMYFIKTDAWGNEGNCHQKNLVPDGIFTSATQITLPSLTTTNPPTITAQNTNTSISDGLSVINVCGVAYTIDTTVNACVQYVFNSHTYTATGVYRDTLQAMNGNDSVIVTTLTINPTYSISTSVTACGQYVLNNHTYTISGVYTDTLHTALGCDSIIVTNLTISKPHAGFYYQMCTCMSNATLFTDTSVVTLGDTISSWNWTVTGIATTYTTQNINVDPPNGIDTICLTITTQHGCTSDTCITIHYTSSIEKYGAIGNVSIYPNPNNGNFTIQLNKNTENIQAVIYDMLGRMVMMQPVTYPISNVLFNAEKGVYQMQLQQNGKILYQIKIVKE